MGVFLCTTLFAQIGKKYDFIRTPKKWVEPYSRKGYSVFMCEVIS
jgi:hypothetical protein